MIEPEPLSAEEILSTFEEQIAPRIDRKAPAPTEPPTALLVVGQPGAGKSEALALLRAEHGALLSIDADRLRRHHPDYDSLPEEQMPRVTGPASGQWLRMSLSYAAQHGYSAAWEATLRSPDDVIASLQDFQRRGYDITVAVMAVPREVSLIGTVQRYLDQRQGDGYGRAVTVEQHDEPYNKAQASIEAIQQAIPQLTLTVVDRDAHQLYPGEYASAAAALEAGRTLTPEDRAKWSENAEQLQPQLRQCNDPAAAEAQRSLHEAAPSTTTAPTQSVAPPSDEEAATALQHIRARQEQRRQAQQRPDQSHTQAPHYEERPNQDPTITP